MNHVELHNNLSQILNDLQKGKIKPQDAKEYFNGAGKLISNCKNELIAVSMGATLEIPLLEIRPHEAKKMIRKYKGEQKEETLPTDRILKNRQNRDGNE